MWYRFFMVVLFFIFKEVGPWPTFWVDGIEYFLKVKKNPYNWVFVNYDTNTNCLTLLQMTRV